MIGISTQTIITQLKTGSLFMLISDELKEKVKNQVISFLEELKQTGEFESSQEVSFFIYNQSLSSGYELEYLFNNKYVLSKDSAFVFLDLHSNKKWSHSCYQLLCSLDNGQIEEKISAMYPTKLYLTEKDSFDQLYTTSTTTLKTPKSAKLASTKMKTQAMSALASLPTNAPGDRYAILFSGYTTDSIDINDLEYFYRTLIEGYGFEESKIFVLNYDKTLSHLYGSDYYGTPWPWPWGTDPNYSTVVDYMGSKNDLSTVFNLLSANIKEDDMLFIFTTSLGEIHDNESSIITYEPGQPDDIGWYTPSDLAQQLTSLPKIGVLLVLMQQNRSGGFKEAVINNSSASRTHFVAACEADKLSATCTNFNCFANAWTNAMSGVKLEPSGGIDLVNADTNADNRISAEEAFNYADQNKGAGDTPLFGSHPSGFEESIFLGYPDYDLFVRDTLDDYGREPGLGNCLSRSPDVIVSNYELSINDEQVLIQPDMMQRDDLGDSVEYGQPNWIYIRVQNRGTIAAAGKVHLYWAEPSTFQNPSEWTDNGITAEHGFDFEEIQPGEVMLVGPIIWSTGIPGVGHYCFICLLESEFDPKPDLNGINTVARYKQFINENNNAAWRNFNVINVELGGVAMMSFKIQGSATQEIATDLELDLRELPQPIETELKILNRLSEGTNLENMQLKEQTTHYNIYSADVGTKAVIKNIALPKKDSSIARVTVTLPAITEPGEYEASIAQNIEDATMGKLTQKYVIKAHPFVGNRKTGEVHKSSCRWAKRMNPMRKEAFDTLRKAFSAGYNGCYSCLRQYDSDHQDFVGNKRSLEFHVIECEWAKKMSPANRKPFSSIAEAIDNGYNGCSYCLPAYDTDFGLRKMLAER